MKTMDFHQAKVARDAALATHRRSCKGSPDSLYQMGESMLEDECDAECGACQWYWRWTEEGGVQVTEPRP